MAETSLEEDLNECHKVFANEVVRALNKFYVIPVDLAPTVEKVKYFTDNMYWGIITISHLFRKENYKVFKSLSKGLKNENYFHECCMFIPTEKNDKFFYNFLKRVSKIYEMAVFCYRNDNNYIETARNCIAQFQDKEYFKSVGSWKRLDRIANFLTSWSKRFRPVMIREMHLSFPVLFTSTNELVETALEEEEELESCDKDRKGLTSNISCPAENDEDYNSALVLLLSDEITDNRELGDIESEVKAIMRTLGNFLLPRSAIYFKKFTQDSKNENVGKEKSQTSRTKNETSWTRREAARAKRKLAAKLFYEQLAEEVSSSLAEKLSIKAKYEELARVIEETKGCFPASSDSSKREENKTGSSSILEEDLYLSSSSNDENIERISEDKDCNENKNPSGGPIHQISDKTTSESYSDSAMPTNNATPSLEEDDYIKFLEYDLFVQARNFNCTQFSHSNSDSDGTEPYNATNCLVDEGDSGAAQSNIPSENNESLTMNIKSEDESEVKNNNLPLAIPPGSSAAASIITKDSDSSSETNNEEQLTPTKSAKSSSSKAVENSNANSNLNDSKPQQRKTNRRKKRGKSKK